ncbi:MAG: hypothetical protein ACOH2Q_11245 [Rhodococcus sp. (in: high G+C Gram-positive bacteria)]
MIESPSVEQFRRLAQSSPWRWTTVEFEFLPTRQASPVHAWIRRPGSIRVETADGRVDEICCAEIPFDGRAMVYSDGISRQAQAQWASDATPVFDADGLVSALPSVEDSWLVDWDDPFYQDYRWIAMLNPIEITRSPHDHSSAAVVTELSDVRVVEHHGRSAWEVIARTTDRYIARCECCPLLSGHYDYEVDTWNPGPPVTVRLDVQTGICVHIGPAGDNPTDDCDLDVNILAVDVPIDDDLFALRR